MLFTVADNGPGIPPEYQEVIFRKFERAKNPNIPRTRSSGLGLAFCKLVVDAHGGRIWVQSAGEGKGSAFHFSLPILPAHKQVRVGSGGAVSGVKVYLRTFGCRANHYDTEAVRAMLTREGHAIVDAASDADVAVFNSCAVTSEAEAELRKVVRRAAKEQPRLRSVVMGCAAALDETRAPALQARALPTVEHVIGGADLPRIADALGLSAAALDLRTTRSRPTRARSCACRTAATSTAPSARRRWPGAPTAAARWTNWCAKPQHLPSVIRKL